MSPFVCWCWNKHVNGSLEDVSKLVSVMIFYTFFCKFPKCTIFGWLVWNAGFHFGLCWDGGCNGEGFMASCYNYRDHRFPPFFFRQSASVFWHVFDVDLSPMLNTLSTVKENKCEKCMCYCYIINLVWNFFFLYIMMVCGTCSQYYSIHLIDRFTYLVL